MEGEFSSRSYVGMKRLGFLGGAACQGAVCIESECVIALGWVALPGA